MSLPIILDKSAFQSLSYKEMILLTNYYLHNITPFLIIEILGDLKKDFAEGKLANERVSEFSNKLFPYSALINEYHVNLVRGEIHGHKVELDFRPIVGNASLKTSETGKTGKHVEQSDEERDLLRWGSGDFLQKDAELAKLWRETTTNQEFILNLQKALRAHKVVGQKINDFGSVNKEVDSVLSEPNNQFSLLNLLFQNYGISTAVATVCINTWSKLGRPLLRDWLPYCHHCLRVDFFYVIGLQYSVVSTRATNRVDLNYLYYLPFTKIFVSNDKLHREIIPYFISSNQDFVFGSELKEDLKKINEYLEKLSDDEKKKYYKDPPQEIETLTFSLYKRHFHIPTNALKKDKPASWYREKIDEFIAAESSGKELDDFAGDFIVRKSMMRITDPCPCGSGKPLKDCHLPENYGK